MKKRGIVLIIIATMALMLTACCSHEWVEATCTEAKHCSLCDKTKGEPLGHEWVEATCTEAKHCTRCDLKDGQALGHTVEEWTVTKEASCLIKGEKTGVCTVCGETVENTIPKLSHTRGEWEVEKEPTFDTRGTRVIKCTVCGSILESEEFDLPDDEREIQYKQACESYTYNEIARNPEQYYGTYGKYYGEIKQIIETDNNNIELRIATKKDYKWYTEDLMYVFYQRKDGESRFLESDLVTFYGKNIGNVTYKTVLGAEVTLPSVNAEYMVLGKEDTPSKEQEKETATKETQSTSAAQTNESKTETSSETANTESAASQSESSNVWNFDTSVVCLDQDGIKVTFVGSKYPYMGVLPDYISLKFMVENNTGEEAQITVKQIFVNGCAITGALGSGNIINGGKSLLNCYFPKEKLDEYGITTLSTINGSCYKGNMYSNNPYTFSINLN